MVRSRVSSRDSNPGAMSRVSGSAKATPSTVTTAAVAAISPAMAPATWPASSSRPLVSGRLVLAAYTMGLLATTSSRLLQSALYGAGDARTPARLAVLRVSVSLPLGAVLMIQLDRFAVTAEGIRRLGELPAFGLLVAAAVAAACGAAERPVVAGLPPLADGVLAGGGVGTAYLITAAASGVSQAREILAALRRRLPGTR